MICTLMLPYDMYTYVTLGYIYSCFTLCIYLFYFMIHTLILSTFNSPSI